MLGWLSPAEVEDLLRTEVVARLGCHAEGRIRPLIVSETSQAAETLAEAETRVRSANGHAAVYRIHLFEKTGRFERR